MTSLRFLFARKNCLLILFFLCVSGALFGCQKNTLTLTDMPWKILWRIGRYLFDEHPMEKRNRNRRSNAVKCTCKDLNLRMQDERMFWRLEDGTFWAYDHQGKKVKGPALFTARESTWLILLVKNIKAAGHSY